MTQYFRRKYELSFGGKAVTDLQISFDVALTGRKEPNTMALTIINLSSATRQKLKAKGEVELGIGWRDSGVTTVFKGEIKTINHAKSDAEWVTTITASDGDTAYRKPATISMAAGTGLDKVIKQLADATGLDSGNVVAKLKDKGLSRGLKDFATGFVSTGRPFEALANIARSLDVNLSIQEGKIVAVEDLETLPGPSVGVSAQTGLIGSPEPGEKKIVKATSLINPRIKPGRLIVLESANIEGNYKVITANHSGDFRGANWYTAMELKPV